MKEMPTLDPSHPYATAYYLERRISNNAFSYDERAELLGKAPSLRVAPLVFCPPSEYTLLEAKETAFEEVEEGKLVSCKGLASFLRLEHPRTRAPITIVDNHNHALYFWLEALREGRIAKGATLVHVDQHKDMRDPGSRLTDQIMADPHASWDFTLHQVHVGSFIVPALDAGLIVENRILDSDASFESFRVDELPDAPLILDIDIDVFAADLAYMDRTRMREVIRALFERAACVTIATSPYFISFEEAKLWTKILLEDAGILTAEEQHASS